MSDSTNIREVKAKLALYEDKLRADDPRFRNSVLLVHEDGSLMYWRFAFLLNMGAEYFGVITEHHGSHVYHRDDILSCTQVETSMTQVESI